MNQASFKALLNDMRQCRICLEKPIGQPLPHEPRPVFQISRTARICICGQAPGSRVHASGRPFTDPSGDRLRDWMGVTKEEFYDQSRIAIIPMGFCFPGLDKKGGDLPPRKECAISWRAKLFAQLPQFELILLVGQYAHRWHLGKSCHNNVTETVQAWKKYTQMQAETISLPLPHPSWRNTGWLNKNPWFFQEVIPFLQAQIRLKL